MAADSARAVARRQREKQREKTDRRRTVVPSDEDPDENPAENAAENADWAATRAALAELSADWGVLHQVAWPGRPGAVIDHVVIGPGGVFVIDSTASAAPGRGAWRPARRRTPQAPVVQDATASVTAVAPPRVRMSVRPVLCSTRAGVPQPGSAPGAVGGIARCAPDDLVGMLCSRPAVLDPATVAGAIEQLAHALAPSTAPSGDGPMIPRPRDPSDRHRSRRWGRPAGGGARTRVRLLAELATWVVLVAGGLLVLGEAGAHEGATQLVGTFVSP